MHPKRSILPLAVIASLAVAVPAAAEASADGPSAHSAGGGAPPVNPAIVGVPLARGEAAIGNAADAIDSGKGADAIGPLRASRRYMIRAYRGAKVLIASAPATPPAEDARASSKRFVKLARRAIRDSRGSSGSGGSWIRAQASGDGGAGVTFADAPTAVFNVFQGHYNVATTAVGMMPDVKGNLLNRVQTVLNTAIVLRNRLVKIIAQASPPAPPEDARAHASGAEVAASFDLVMPGVSTLIGDEIQQIQATKDDPTLAQGAAGALNNALSADQQIKSRVDTLWPPVPADD